MCSQEQAGFTVMLADDWSKSKVHEGQSFSSYFLSLRSCWWLVCTHSDRVRSLGEVGFSVQGGGGRCRGWRRGGGRETEGWTGDWQLLQGESLPLTARHWPCSCYDGWDLWPQQQKASLGVHQTPRHPFFSVESEQATSQLHWLLVCWTSWWD